MHRITSWHLNIQSESTKHPNALTASSRRAEVEDKLACEIVRKFTSLTEAKVDGKAPNLPCALKS